MRDVLELAGDLAALKHALDVYRRRARLRFIEPDTAWEFALERQILEATRQLETALARRANETSPTCLQAGDGGRS